MPEPTYQAYIRDKWRPVIVLERGRKLAKVRANGAVRNSRVPVDAIREVKLTEPSITRPGPVQTSGFRLVEEEHYLRLQLNGSTIAVFLPGYRGAAAECLAVLQKGGACASQIIPY